MMCMSESRSLKPFLAMVASLVLSPTIPQDARPRRSDRDATFSLSILMPASTPWPLARCSLHEVVAHVAHKGVHHEKGDIGRRAAARGGHHGDAGLRARHPGAETPPDRERHDHRP